MHHLAGVDRNFRGGLAAIGEQSAARTPMGRIASAADVASVIVSIAVDQSMVTGQLLAVDGGAML